jgi:N-methylhydantoinase A
MSYRLGVDVGGTFTDLLLLDEKTGSFWRHKTPSTPHDSSEGVMIGVEAICAKASIKPADVDIFLHGSSECNVDSICKQSLLASRSRHG